MAQRKGSQREMKRMPCSLSTKAREITLAGLDAVSKRGLKQASTLAGWPDMAPWRNGGWGDCLLAVRASMWLTRPMGRVACLR
ncbi:MAG: hypothetical protein U0176_16680 [Bacteroidia bacterium]